MSEATSGVNLVRKQFRITVGEKVFWTVDLARPQGVIRIEMTNWCYRPPAMAIPTVAAGPEPARVVVVVVPSGLTTRTVWSWWVM